MVSSKSLPIVPSLAIGGISSIFIAKGMYVTQRLLQRSMKSAMDMLQPPGPEVSVVPVALRGHPRTSDPVLRIHRKGGSCGCLLLTRTGIFYIQPVNLWLFKASPWGFQGPSEQIDEYQLRKTRLSAKATQLYGAAVDDSASDSRESLANECAHLLLHMLLSDIQNIARFHASDNFIDDFSTFKSESLSLISSVTTLRSSTDVLTAWTFTQDSWIKWLSCLPNDTAFFMTSSEDHDDGDSNSILGIENWESVPAFSMHMQQLPEPDFWNSKPDIEQENGKWAHLGRLRYTFNVSNAVALAF